MGTRTEKLKTTEKPKKQNGGQNKHQATEENKIKVSCFKICGLTHDKIAEHLGISKATLHKHYQNELDYGSENMDTQIVGALFAKAMKGDTAALIFWCKTRLGWKETQVQEVAIPTMRLFRDAPQEG